MSECLCGHGEWCDKCTSIPLPDKKEEKPNYKYESFEDWFKLEGSILFAEDIWKAAREVKGE